MSRRSGVLAAAASLTAALLLTTAIPADAATTSRASRSTSGGGSGVAASSRACGASQLEARLTGDEHDVTAVYRFVVLTNTGARCSLRGHPTMTLSSHGRRVGAPSGYFPYSPTGGSPRLGTVVVPHRGHASVWLALALAGHASCRKAPVDALQMRIPHSSSLRVAVPRRDVSRLVVCSSSTAQVLDVSQFLR